MKIVIKTYSIAIISDCLKFGGIPSEESRSNIKSERINLKLGAEVAVSAMERRHRVDKVVIGPIEARRCGGRAPLAGDTRRLVEQDPVGGSRSRLRQSGWRDRRRVQPCINRT